MLGFPSVVFSTLALLTMLIILVPAKAQADSADLGVLILDAPDLLVVGNEVTYEIGVQNLGPSAASGVWVSNVLPAGFRVVSAWILPAQGAVTTNGNVVVCSGIVLDTVISNILVVIKGVPSIVGDSIAAFTVGGMQPDPILANNTVTIPSTVLPIPDLAIGLTGFPEAVVPGSNVTYTISVTNLGPAFAAAALVTNVLPAGVRLLATNATQGTVSTTNNVLIWNVGTISNGARASLINVVATSVNGTLTNSATVAASGPDPNPANNSATVTTLVAPPFVSIVPAGAFLVEWADQWCR